MYTETRRFSKKKLYRVYLRAVLGYNNFLSESSILLRITENNPASGMGVAGNQFAH